MPLTYKIDHDKRFVTAHADGVIALDDFLVYYEGLAIENAMSYSKLFDASASQLKLSSDDAMTLGAWTSAFAQRELLGPIAILCKSEENENAFRRHMNLGDARRRIKLFKTRTRALKWLSAETRV